MFSGNGMVKPKSGIADGNSDTGLTENIEKNKNNKRQKTVLPILFVILLIMVITIGISGFLLGRYAGLESEGKLVDTIVLSPVGELHQSGGEEITHFLSGAVYDKAGEVCTDVYVKLGDKSRKYVDENGKFFFTDIRSGSHDLRVFREEDMLASTVVSFKFNQTGKIIANITADTGAELTVPDDVRVVELKLTINDDSLNVDKDGSCMITKTGDVITFDSKKISKTENDLAVTNGGNLVSPDGFVIFPADSMAITPEGVVDALIDTQWHVPGIKDETFPIETETGIVVNPDSSVTQPDGTITESGGGTIVIEDENVTIVEDPIEDYIPPEDRFVEDAGSGLEEDTVQESRVDDTKGGQGNDIDIPPKNGEGSVSESDDEPLPAETPLLTPKPTATPEPINGFDVESEETNVSWNQQSIVDLFGKKDFKLTRAIKKNDTMVNEINGIPVIAPGTSGYYLFNIKNDSNYPISYTLRVEEITFHLPMQFSLYRESDFMLYSYREKMFPDEGVMTPEITVLPNTSETFRLEWTWGYEDRLTPEKDNAYDMAGAQETGYYMIGLNIKATQKITSNGGDDIRYPGKSPSY